MPYDGVISMHGDPGETYRITGVDVPKTLAEYGIPITDGAGCAPVSVLVTVETNAGRVKFGSQNGQGHQVAVGDSYMGNGTPTVRKMKLGNATVGSNAVFEVTVYF